MMNFPFLCSKSYRNSRYENVSVSSRKLHTQLTMSSVSCFQRIYIPPKHTLQSQKDFNQHRMCL